MESLPKCYTILFNAVTDALKAMDEQNFGTAKTLLLEAQKAAEAAYLTEQPSK